jgi:F-type H+-transporting ATPase subunit a
MITANSIKKIIVCLLFLFPFFNGVFGQERQTETSKKAEEFNITNMIMHHIKDAHSFHIYGNTEDHFPKALSIPLPIILWTNNGLVTFMSSEFHHDEAGKIIVEKKKQKFVIVHNKIYYANNSVNKHGTYVTLNAEDHLGNVQPMDFSITKNVFSMFLSMLVLFLIFISVANSYKKSDNNVPKGIAKFMEPIIMFVRDEIAVPNIGKKHYVKYMPFLLTIFFFIWLNNIFGLIPFFPFSSNLSGNIAFTGGLALITFITTMFSSKKTYWLHMLWMPGIPVYMKLFLAPIEIIGMFIKPIALMIRLFANITAGHIVVLSLIGLIFMMNSVWVSPASVLFSVFISVIEVLVIAIQAYIFTMLSALYFGQALEEEH